MQSLSSNPPWCSHKHHPITSYPENLTKEATSHKMEFKNKTRLYPHLQKDLSGSVYKKLVPNSEIIQPVDPEENNTIAIPLVPAAPPTSPNIKTKEP